MHERYPHGPKSTHWNGLKLSSAYLCPEQLDQTFNTRKEAFFRRFLDDNRQEGHEKLLVACGKKTLP